MCRLTPSAASGEKQAHPELLVGERVVAGKRVGAPAADEIAARIADMGNSNAIKAQGAGDYRGSHGASTRGSRQSRVVHMLVGGLHQALQQRPVRFARNGLRESGQQRSYGQARGYLAVLVASDAIGEREQPAVAAGPRRRVRSHIAQIVLVLLADESAIAKLRELQFHPSSHGLYLRRSRGGSSSIYAGHHHYYLSLFIKSLSRSGIAKYSVLLGSPAKARS